MRRLWTRLICHAALAAVGLWALPATAAPPSASIHRIIAVGDLHGDFSAWRDIARGAKLVDEKGRWIGGHTVLVQTGDVVDRGPDSLKIMLDLIRLQREAATVHGQVIALVGNHEAMNMTGDLRYVSAGDYAALTDTKSAGRRDATFTFNKAAIEAAYRQHDPAMTDDAIKQAWIAATPLGRLEHQIAWAPTGGIGKWVAGNPAVVLLDGNFFVHGGISPGYASMPIAEINRQVSAALIAQSQDPQSIINAELGPLWYRGLVIAQVPQLPAPAADKTAGPPAAPAAPTNETPGAVATTAPAEPPIQDQVEHLLSVYGAKRIVIAHTPNLAGIVMQYDGRLIRIDTGISAVYGGKVSYLEILDGVPNPHIVERSSAAAK